MAYSIQALDARQHWIAEFACGEPVLDHWLQTMAGQHRKRHISSTFICIDPEQGGTVIGYYALTVAEIAKDSFPELLRKMPQIIPVVKLGRLAIDQRFQGQGFGQILLADAITRSATQVAGVGLVVDALHEKAARFYRNLGFIVFPDQPLRFFYPLANLK